VEYLLLPQLSGEHENLHLLRQADPVWLGAAAALETFSLLVYGGLTLAVLPARHRPPYSRVMRIDLATLAASHVMPAGSAVGLGLGYQLLTDAGVDSTDAGIAKAMQAVGSALVLNMILWVTLVVSLPLHGANAAYVPAAGVGIALLTASAVTVGLLSRHERRIGEMLGAALGWLPFLTKARVAAAVRATATHVHHLRDEPTLLARIAVLAAVNWLLDAAALWAAVTAFGHTLGPIGLLIPYCIANVLAALPITPAGLGVMEAFLIPALVGFGTPRGVAILGVLGWRLFNFLLPIPAGAVAYLTLPTSDPKSASRTEGAGVDAHPR
jgi:uncharacterized protein (TIRG00374 family)